MPDRYLNGGFLPGLLALVVACQRPEPSSPRSIRVGGSVTDSLTARDGARGGRGPYHAWALTGTQNQRLVIDVTSGTFYPKIVLRDAHGSLIGRKAHDVAQAQGIHVRLLVVLPRSGSYRLEITSGSGHGLGVYAIAVAGWAPTPDAPAPGSAPTLSVGETRTGLFEPGDELAEDSSFRDSWAFEARAGQLYRVEMTSWDLDPHLTVLGPDRAYITSDHGTLNVELTFTATTAGRHTALASGSGFGVYRVTLAEAQPTHGSTAIATLSADSGGWGGAEGELQEGDSATGDGFVDSFAYTPVRTGSVIFEVSSDSYGMGLVVEDATGAPIARSAPGEEDCTVTVDLVAGRRYVLRVGGPPGVRYSLRAQRHVTPP